MNSTFIFPLQKWTANFEYPFNIVQENKQSHIETLFGPQKSHKLAGIRV